MRRFFEGIKPRASFHAWRSSSGSTVSANSRLRSSLSRCLRSSASILACSTASTSYSPSTRSAMPSRSRRAFVARAQAPTRSRYSPPLRGGISHWPYGVSTTITSLGSGGGGIGLHFVEPSRRAVSRASLICLSLETPCLHSIHSIAPSGYSTLIWSSTYSGSVGGGGVGLRGCPLPSNK